MKLALRLILCQADGIDEPSLPGIVKFLLALQILNTIREKVDFP